MFDKLIRQLEKLERAAESLVIESAKDNEHLIRSLNTFGQLFKGLDAQGDEIRPPYRPRTIRRKQRKGQPSNRVTVKDTGRFYVSVVVVFAEDQFLIVSKDPKTEGLQRKYGGQLLGLNDESLQLLIDGIRTDFFMKSKTFLFK